MISPAVPGRWLVPALMVGTFVNFLAALAFAPFLSEIASDVGSTVALIGQVPALMTLLASLLGLIAGPLADHYGYRRTLIVGVLAVAVNALAIGLAPNYAILLTVVVVGSIGRAVVQPTSQAAVASYFTDPRARRASMSRVSIGVSGAGILGIPLLTWVAGLWGWRAAFFTLSALAFLAVANLWRSLPWDTSDGSQRLQVGTVLRSYLPILRHRSTLGLMLSNLLGNTGMWLFWIYIPSFLIQERGFSTTEVGWVNMGSGLAVIAGNLISGTRLGQYPRQLLIASRLLAGTLLACALLLPVSGLTAAVLAVLAMVPHGLFSVTNALLLTSESPAGRATTMTMNSSGMSLGFALGGALGGLALALGGYPALGYWGPAFLVGAATLVWWFRPRALVQPAPAPASH